MSPAEPSPRPASTLPLFAAAAAIILLGLAAYHGAYGGPFLFDDTSAVLRNASIRQLWPPGPVLSPPADATVAGRPLLNLSFALNHALGGLQPAGYHAFNVGVHLLAGLVLFGLAHRTLRRPALRARLGDAALPAATAIAALWVLHPIQTNSVTYISQRAESLMGLFYLLTVYAFSRRDDSAHPAGWDFLAIAAFFLGLACKEVIVTAPVMVLLYDRTFVAGSFREALRRHARLYLGLAVGWMLFAVQLEHLRGHAVGTGLGVSWQSYALTECQVVVSYLGLALWPHPLVFDYGENLTTSTGATVLCVIAVAAWVAGTIAALRWRPVSGFLGAWFLIILAPTSSVVPIVHQPMAENRLYLPLVAVVAGIVAGLQLLAGRRALVAGAAALALGFGILTARRNIDYSSEVALWQDTAAKRPANPRARYNLGQALAAAHRPAEAVSEYEAALALDPRYAAAHHNLGNALSEMRRWDDAVRHYEAALALQPAYASAHYNLAIAYVEQRRFDDAIRHFEQALRLEPGAAGVHYSLGSALVQVGRNDDAIAHFAEAIRLSADYPEAHTNWGNVLAQAGYWSDAMSHYEAALKSDPANVEAHINLGNALLQQRRTDDAAAQYQAALRANPNSAEAHYNLGNILLARADLSGAVVHFESAIRLNPSFTGAHHNLGLALVRAGKPELAIVHYQAALRLMPDSAIAHHNFAVALEKSGHRAEAIAEDEEALRLQPSLAEARVHLAALRSR